VTPGDGDDGEKKRSSIGGRLGARARRLSLRNEPHDTGQRRLFARTRHLDAQRSGAVHGAGDDLRARFLANRSGFARDHRLVHVAGARAHNAVRWNGGTGPNEPTTRS